MSLIASALYASGPSISSGSLPILIYIVSAADSSSET
jgi:hypothetical protein